MFHTIIKTMEESNNIVILSHAAPDGDSLGSSLALYNYLLEHNKQVTVIVDDEVPHIYKFLKGADKIERVGYADDFDLAVVVDSSDAERLGKTDRYLANKKIINIDHHLSNSKFGTYNIVDSKASATAEIIYEIFESQNIVVSRDIAECLYVGIVTDTGQFQYSNTTSKTHRITESLLDKGVKPAQIYKLVYQNNTKGKTKLIAYAINSLDFYCEDRISSMVLSKDDYSSAGATDEDTEGIINFGRDISSVELALLFKESSKNKVKVSFRSKSKIDVNILAAEFGGGGHKSAAGATIIGELKDVKISVLNKAFKLFGEN